MVALSPRSRTAGIALVVALLAVASVGAASGLGDVRAQSSQHLTNGTVPPADEVYVEGNGDAVLVYRKRSTTNSVAQGHYGVDVAEGLLHLFVVRDATGTQVTGNGSLVLKPDELTGGLNLTAPKPESISSLDLDASLTRTDETARGQVSLEATLQTDDLGSTSIVSSVSTHGSITSSATSFRTAGTVNATLSSPVIQRQERTYTLRETGQGYVLEASVRRPLSATTADRYNTSAKTKRILESRYAAIARSLGGDATLTLSAYEYIESGSGPPVLDAEFTVRYTGVDEAVSNRLAQVLAQSGSLGISEERANQIAGAVADVRIDRIGFTLDVSGRSVSTAWTVAISNYDEIAMASLDLAASVSEDENTSTLIERARTRYQAQRASNLTTTVSWDASFTTSGDTAQIDATVSYDTENWGAYVDALADRGAPTPGSLSVAVHAATVEGNVVTNVSVTLRQSDLVNRMIASLSRSAGQSVGGGVIETFTNAFERAGFQRARVDVSIHDGKVTLEAGASFGNLSAFESVVQEEYPALNVASLYGEYHDGGTTNYVHLSGAFDGTPTEAEVRNHSAVGAGTTIHLPDEWNPGERDFPSPNATAIRNYLGRTGSTNSPGLTGFTVSLAVAGIAALAAIVVLRRRRP